MNLRNFSYGIRVVQVYCLIMKTDLKSKSFCNSYGFTPLREKETCLIDSKFYQKLFVVLIALSTILIFSESPKEKEKICAIATIPKWITRTPGSKYFIQKSIFILEKHISVFIDWGEDFSNKNHIYEYPSLLIIYNNMGKITEIGRVTGDYNNKNWKKFISLSNLFNISV